MGLAQGGGTLGNAVGTITINTQGVAAAATAVKAASADMTSSLNQVAPAAAKAQGGMAGLVNFLKAQTGIKDTTSAVKALVGAFGVTLGAAGVVLAGKKLLEMGASSIKAASDLAESTNKINVAFGASGAAMLDWSKNSADAFGLSQQQALEAASSFGLLFSTMGVGEAQAAEMSKSLVLLAADMASINNISPEEALEKLRSGLVGETEPLRAVGVLLDEASVKAKAMAMGLAPSAAALTQQDKVLARYQLILDQTTKTQGDFANTSGGLANQTRILTGHVGNLSAAFGKNLAPAVLTVVGAMNDLLGIMDKISKQGPLIELPAWMTADPIGDFAKNFEFTNKPGTLGFQRKPLQDERSQMAAQQSASVRAGRASGAVDPSTQIHQDWAKGMADVQKTSDADMLAEESSFGASRAKTVADYAKSVARDEASYARGRLRANIDFLDSLAAVAKDATRREAGMASDLARTQSTTRADSAEREADARKEAGKNLAKLDEQYAKDRVKAAKDLSDNMLDAAGDLDAKRVYELQRDFAKSEKEAATAHDDARKAVADGLAERLSDEAESLAKSLSQQQEAYDRSIEEGRANDALRLQDMKDAFIKSQEREAEDHAIQVSQRAEDQAAQLAEMDTQHGLRMNQIRTHAIEERAALQQAADDAAIAAGVASEALLKQRAAEEKQREDLWDKFHKHIIDSLTPRTLAGGPVKAYAEGGYVPRTGLAMLHGGEYVLPRSAVSRGGMSGRSVSIGDVNINVGGSNASAGDIGRAVREEMIRVLEEAA